MKRSSKRSSFVAVVLALLGSAGTSLYGQAQTQNQPPSPARSRCDEMLERWNAIGNKLVAMAQDFPEEKYDFKVQKDQRTFAENLLHAAALDFVLIRRVSGSNFGPDFGEGDNPTRDVFKTKADVVKFVQEAIADGAQVIQQQGDAGLDNTSKFFGNRLAHNSTIWTFAVEHSGEHYGQLVVYYRANNLVPPDSRRNQAQERQPQEQSTPKTPFGQWNPQKSNTTASLHGVSIVNANVVWASGTDGTFVRTTDGGETWQAGSVPGGEKLDFRDVYAVDAKTAYLMSIGNGNESQIYKTTDAGKTWSLQYTEQNPKATLDCMAFWDATRGIVVGDAVDGKSELLTTSDGGAHWTPLRPESMPGAKAGEGSPASGTCIATYSEKKGKKETWHAWFVTENASRVFHAADAGKTWTASETPLVTGLNQGVFSIAVVDANRLAIVGGDYDRPQMVKPNSAYSEDGGRTWKESSHRPTGYRWCVAIVPDTLGPTAFAAGPSGMDYSIDGGKNWDQMNEVSANTIAFAEEHHGWAVGRKGLILKFEGTVPGGAATTPERAAGSSFRDCAECPEMVVIPAGNFTMGSSAEEKSWAASHGGSTNAVSDEAPQHQVSLPSFALGKYDVTRGEYAAFARETGYAAGDGCGRGRAIFKWEKDPKLTWENPGHAQTDRDPVVCVNWQDARAYIAWLNRKADRGGAASASGPYRLPSEAEWEYAARAGTTTKFQWGDDDAAAPVHAWFNANSGCEKVEGLFCDHGEPHPVGAKPPNAFGLYDMAGNVWQWTEDCYDNSYAGIAADGRANEAPSSDPKAKDGQGNCLRVDRGGSWMFPAWLLRPATRERNPADYRNDIMGFRVARTLP